MKIKEWEKYVFNKYKAIKVKNFSELKNYLSYKNAYSTNFTPKGVNEGEFSNEEFYGAYVFDENDIAGREVETRMEYGWTKLIVLIASNDAENISDYTINTAGGLTAEETTAFYRDINPMKKD